MRGGLCHGIFLLKYLVLAASEAWLHSFAIRLYGIVCGAWRIRAVLIYAETKGQATCSCMLPQPIFPLTVDRTVSVVRRFFAFSA